MLHVRYSLDAEYDLLEIAEYTKLHWSLEQADRYVEQLERTCMQLGVSQQLSRRCDRVLPGLRRMESASHVVYFTVDETEILIVRILHNSMLPQRHLL